MPQRSTIGTSPLSALSEVPAPPRPAPAPLSPSLAPSPAERAMAAWAAWLAASFQAALELQSGLWRANLIGLDSARRSHEILARQWPCLTREVQHAMLDAFASGLSAPRGPTHTGG